METPAGADKTFLASLIPAFALQMNGKLGLDLNTEAVADILKLPQCEIANTNVWELM
jgi:hypothetical protein